MTEARRYVATIKPKPTTKADWSQVSINQMTIDFTIGPEAPHDGPETIIEATLKNLHVTGLMDVEYRVWQGDRGTPRREPEPVNAVTIHNAHGSFTPVPGREYALETQITGVERKPRYSRMGYLGIKRGPGPKYLQFSARGPDRTHGGQYGGTNEIHERNILDALEVSRDESKRYCALTYEQTRRFKITGLAGGPR